MRPAASQAQADLALRIIRRPGYDVEVDNQVFDVKELWSLGFWQDHTVIKRFAEKRLARLALLQPDMHAGEVYRVGDATIESGLYAHPLLYPLDMLLYVCALSQGRGVMLHSAGVIDRGLGRIFVGHSSAGKSTTARLWHAQDGVQVLNDDRIILRQRDGRFWMYGTPWHGELGVISAQAAPVEGLYLLARDQINRLKPLKPVEAVARLLSCSISTFWDATGMEFTMRFLDELVQQVPCFELGFVPDASAVDFVRWQKS